MKCPLCGLEFQEAEGETACQECPMSSSCSLVKCPNCGYEVPREPPLFRIVKGWIEQWKASKGARV